MVVLLQHTRLLELTRTVTKGDPPELLMPSHACTSAGANASMHAAGFLLSGGNGRMLGAALIVIAATAAWTLAHMVPFFYGMRTLGLLRVAEDEELMGLDRSHHGGSAYDTDLAGVDKLSVKLAAGGMEGSRHDRILHRCASPSAAPPRPFLCAQV